jgi:hypothetical protein
VASKTLTPLLVKLQILLDRAHASPGEIDGQGIAAYAEMKGLEPTEEINEELSDHH